MDRATPHGVRVSQAPYDLERQVARALGGRRSGRGFAGPDVLGTPYAVECKRQGRLSLKAADLEQARRQARLAELPMLLVLRAHHQTPIAVMEWADWFALHIAAHGKAA